MATTETEVRSYPWDPALVDWPRVAADVREHKAGCEARAQQIVAEARANASPLRLRDQEERAAMQRNADACEELLALLEERGYG